MSMESAQIQVVFEEGVVVGCALSLVMFLRNSFPIAAPMPGPGHAVRRRILERRNQ